MAVLRCKIILIIGMVSLFSVQAFPQQMNNVGNRTDSSVKVILKPRLNYMIGSNFILVPHLGSVTSVTLSPSLSVPLSHKLSVDGGIIAGYYYSAPWKSNNEGLAYGTFTGLSVYGSANYHLSPQLTLYGSAIRQLAGTSPFSVLPKTSYSIGSSYDFGNFSIGVTLHTSKWDYDLNNMPYNGSQGFYSPFEHGPGTFNPFGP